MPHSSLKVNSRFDPFVDPFVTPLDPFVFVFVPFVFVLCDPFVDPFVPLSNAGIDEPEQYVGRGEAMPVDAASAQRYARKSAFLEWCEKDGLLVISDYGVEDPKAAPLKHWERLAVRPCTAISKAPRDLSA